MIESGFVKKKGIIMKLNIMNIQKICNVWTYVSKDNWSNELVEELERGE